FLDYAGSGRNWSNDHRDVDEKHFDCQRTQSQKINNLYKSKKSFSRMAFFNEAFTQKRMKKTKNKPNLVIEVPKYIRTSARAMSYVSEKWVIRFAYKLFISPVRFPTPKREKGMDTFSVKYPMILPKS